MACKRCGAPVSFDEAGLNKKLINRGISEYFCINCLSEALDIPVARLKEKMEEYRKAGCLLFVPLEK